MTKLILIAILMLMAQSTFAHQTQCSSNHGLFQYRSSSYEGGAHPYEGMEMGRESWLYKGSVVGEKVRYYSTEESTSGNLGELDHPSKHITNDHHSADKPTGQTKYTIIALMPTHKGSLVKKKLACIETFPTIPRP